MALSTLLEIASLADSSPYNGDPGKVWRFYSHDGVLLGKIREDVVSKLTAVPWLSCTDSAVQITDPVDLEHNIAELVNHWRRENAFNVLKGWRDELYTVWTSRDQVYFRIERSAAALFGLVTYGVHITGFYVEKGEYRIWVPRRSPTKQTYPNTLDNTVAGGLGNGLGFWETAIKECGEEAGIPPIYAEQHLRSAGLITYEFIDPHTGYIQPEVECVYDIDMGSDVRPKPVDGEVAEFYLMTVPEVIKTMQEGAFKYNCALVLIDFLIRHGLLSPGTCSDYSELIQRCHRKLEYPICV